MVCVSLLMLTSSCRQKVTPPTPSPATYVKPPAIKTTKVELPQPEKKPKKHPSHKVVVWTTEYRDRTFRVIKLPRCEHIQTIITYNPAGETKEEAKERVGGIAVCSASFYDPKTMKPVDFFRSEGTEIVGRQVGRWFLAIFPDGQLEITNDYDMLRADPAIDAVALGQRLVPFHHDGFTTEFANRVTDRMALGFSRERIYIVQGNSDLWVMGEFMDEVLYCDIAINTDGGHSVKGISPFHLVFKWKEPTEQKADSGAASEDNKV